MRVYHLPYQNVLPVPLFKPSKLPSSPHYALAQRKSRAGGAMNGAPSQEREARQVTKALQPDKPGVKISSLLPQQSIRCPSMH